MEFLQLIVTKIHAYLKPEELAENNSEEELLTLIEYAGQLNWQFMNHLLSTQHEDHTRISVTNAQITIVMLSNKIQDYKKELSTIAISGNKKKSILAIYATLNNHFYQFYELLHTSYSCYFNFTEQMPIFSWKLRASEITANLNLFKQASTNHLHPLLWEGFQFPYEELLNSSELCTPNYAVTYYLQTILSLSMAQYEQSDDYAEEKIIDSLVLNNFNSPVFVEKLLIYYNNIYTANELIETQIICWKTLLQHFGRMLQHAHEVLYEQLPTINIQLSKGIEEIIKALELRVANEGNIDGVIPSIQTNLTLSQLAVMLRLMVESGVIQTNNNSEFFKTAVLLFRTRRATDITAGSLSTKYYNPNQTATTIIKDYLIMMLNNSKNLGE